MHPWAAYLITRDVLDARDRHREQVRRAAAQDEGGLSAATTTRPVRRRPARAPRGARAMGCAV
jgi:hypothetical protein